MRGGGSGRCAYQTALPASTAAALIGIAIYGGNGSPAGFNNSGGTLYELTLY
jgi:hypothetical protein